MFYSVPSVTRTLIGINVAMFAAQLLLGDVILLRFALWPIQSAALGGVAGFQPWQILTYAFLHGTAWHLSFNMFALFMFGSELERLWGPKRFLNLYLASVISAALAQLAVSSLAPVAPYPTIGASGGVFGLLLAFALYFPRRTVVLLLPPIPMPAWLFVTLYGALELYLGISGTAAGVAHFAHLGGMFGAWLLIQYWRGRPPFRLR
jgi:membrane associated rhomboid family serine protease